MHLFKRTNATPPTTHKEVKQQILEALHGADPGTSQYKEILQNYKEVCEIEAQAKNSRKTMQILAPIFGNVGVASVIGLFEARGYIFTSKAVPLVISKLTGRP